MEAKLIFWDYQGTGHARFHKFIAEYRKDFNPDMFCLMETRISGRCADNIINKLNFPNSCRVEAEGFSGGIWVF